MKIKSSYVEGFALLILLFSFGWQLYENEADQRINDQYVINIQNKLDALWKVAGNSDNTHEYRKMLYDQLNETWQYQYDIETKRDNLNTVHNVFMKERILLYIIGSVLLIFSKFMPKEIT